jgi:hypothetical protein
VTRKLGQSSLSDSERLTEAKTLLLELVDMTEAMNAKERSFVEDMNERSYCSPNQLFWLRDLHQKYCI